MKNSLSFFSLLLLSVLLFSSCEKECTNTVRKFSAAGFDAIDAGDENRITITSSSEFYVSAEGCDDDVDDLQVYVNNGVLKIKYPSYKKNRDDVRFVINMPTLRRVVLSGDASCTINGFSDTTARSFSISGSGGCSYYGNASYLDAQISGAGYLTVSGNILLADVDVSGESRFEGKNMLANSTTTILASGDARGYVNTIDTLTADASGQARIYYKGDPTVKNFTTSGQGKILPF